jgi:hypothetical protein
VLVAVKASIFVQGLQKNETVKTVANEIQNSVSDVLAVSTSNVLVLDVSFTQSGRHLLSNKVAANVTFAVFVSSHDAAENLKVSMTGDFLTHISAKLPGTTITFLIAPTITLQVQQSPPIGLRDGGGQPSGTPSQSPGVAWGKVALGTGLLLGGLCGIASLLFISIGRKDKSISLPLSRMKKNKIKL